jgi:hypothetical protein
MCVSLSISLWLNASQAIYLSMCRSLCVNRFLPVNFFSFFFFFLPVNSYRFLPVNSYLFVSLSTFSLSTYLSP